MDIPSDWTFKNIAVAKDFDYHVRSTLPWYDMATGAVAHVARHYVQAGGLIYDIGASTGNIGRALEDVIQSRGARLVSIDDSEAMAEKYSAPGKLVIADAMTYEYEEFDVAICMLLLMFLPPGRRKSWLQELTKKIKPGGAIILIDKCEGPSGYLSTVMHRLTIAGKVSTGIPADQIVAKELSLQGVQRPIPENFITMAVPSAHEFFRFGEFAGWVITRPE
jgi:tRNA (cmo5U34)-methyltransferase